MSAKLPIILAVDDEEENLDLLERTLCERYDVRTAKDGASALALLELEPNVALIITDQRMPGITGTELLKRARKERPGTVRVVLTGYTSPADLIDAINSSNVYRFLTKPWDLEELTVTVERAVRLHAAGGGDAFDELSGLPSKATVRRELEREVARAELSKAPLALLVIRVGGLDHVSGARGASAKERLFARVATAASALLSPVDVLGAGENGTLIAICAGSGYHTAFAERFRSRIDAEIPGLSIDVQVVTWPDAGRTASELWESTVGAAAAPLT